MLDVLFWRLGIHSGIFSYPGDADPHKSLLPLDHAESDNRKHNDRSAFIITEVVIVLRDGFSLIALGEVIRAQGGRSDEEGIAPHKREDGWEYKEHVLSSIRLLVRTTTHTARVVEKTSQLSITIQTKSTTSAAHLAIPYIILFLSLAIMRLYALFLWWHILVALATPSSRFLGRHDVVATDSIKYGAHADNISLSDAADVDDDPPEDPGPALDGVKAEAYWWGFQITLSPDAVRVMNTLASTIAAAMGFSSPPVAAAVGLAVATRALLYEAIAGDGILTLSSPWPIPLMLAPWSARDTRVDQISYTSFWAGAFSPVTRIYGEHVTDFRPAFGLYEGDLYMFYSAVSDAIIYYMKYDPDYGWGTVNQIPYTRTEFDVAACEYNGQLHVLHRGAGKDAAIWHVRLSGDFWTPDALLDGMYTSAGPALATYQGLLYMVAVGTDEELWWASYNGTAWSAYQNLAGYGARYGAALAEYNGLLYCVARGTDGRMWWTKFDGSKWSPYDVVGDGNARTSGPPALTPYMNRLLLVARGNEGHMWYTRFDGSTWDPYRDTNIQLGGNGVGLATYKSILSDNTTREEAQCAFKN
ncbi:hypothetical protein F4777DRAFT_598766 [Nemania sp. FL0916]|nr:hypothetical protein F4777DRAFT_598766 [Nemania sp. FL0916]